MDVRLPNGKVIRGVPEGTPKDAIKTKAVQAGLANANDFLSPQQVSGDIPVMESEMGMLPQVYDAPPQQPQFSLGEKALGVAETGMALGSGMLGGLVGQPIGTVEGLIQSARQGTFGTQEGAQAAAATAHEYMGDLTYQPRTEAGQAFTQEAAKALTPLAHGVGVAPMLAGVEGAAMRSGVSQAVPSTTKGARVINQAFNEAGTKLKESIGRRRQSRYYTPDADDLSVGSAQTEGATRRIQTAESLPVPVKLTRGAATRNAPDLAFEKEQMKMQMGGPLRDRIEENNLQILQNFDEFVDQTGAQALHTSKSATGRSIVKPLAMGLEKAKGKVNLAYTKANNSPESRISVSPIALQRYVNNQITGSESVQVVDAVRKYVSKRKNNTGRIDQDGNIELGHFTDTGDFMPSLTVGKMEELRQFINTHKLSNPTDNAHTIIMKNAIDEPVLPVAGPLYNKARRLRQRQGELYENRAVVARLLNTKKGGKDPQVALDEVFNKTIMGGSPEEITFIRRVLKNSGEDGRQAWRELQGSTVDYIRERATAGMGMDSNDMHVVSPAKLSQAMKQLDSDGRLDVVFGKKQAQVMRDLNDVVKYVHTVPPGTLINNSGTTATLLLALGEMGGTGAATGIPLPIISSIKIIRGYVKDRAIKKKIDNFLTFSQRTLDAQ